MRIGVILPALAMLAACEPAGAPPPRLVSQSDWQPADDKPILPAGSLREQALWNDPSVVRTQDGYVMYMTTSTQAPFEPPILPFRAVSADGAKWRLDPARALLSPDGGPYASIETPSVVRFNGLWHMFFTGIYPDPDPSPMAIGHAVSSDGIAWRIREWKLFGAAGDGWQSYLVGEPGAVVHGDRLIVYFSAVGAREGGGPPLQSIGLSSSTDGRNFSSVERAFGQGAAYPVEQGFAGYSSPAAVSWGGDVHLFYSVVHWQSGGDPEWKQVAIHHARSRTGTSGFEEDGAPIISTADSSWTSGEVLAPAPLIEDGQVKVWFGGHVANSELAPLIRRNISGPEFGIGLVTAPVSVLGGQQ